MKFDRAWFGPGIWERYKLPGSARHLATVRIAFAGFILYLYSSPMLLFMHDLRLPRFRHDTWSLLPRPVEAFLYVEAVPVLYGVGIVATAAMLIGLRTRLSSAVAGLCFMLLYASYYRMTKSHVDWPYWNVIFLVFAFAPSGDRYSVDRWWRERRGTFEALPAQSYRWPVETVILWAGVTYVAAGFAKVFPLRAGVVWLDGGMLHKIITEHYFHSPIYWLLGEPAFDYSLHWPFAVGSIAAVILELSAVLMFVQRRLNLPLMIGLVGLHTGIYIGTGVIAFVYDAMILTLFFIPPEKFPDHPDYRGREKTAPVNEN